MQDIQAKEIKIIDIDSIIPNPKNANKHPQEQIKRLEKLIKYQGFRNPLVISNRTGFLIAGHGRLEAAKNLDIKELPVIYQDFESEAQEYAYLVSDNEIARWSELDKESILDEISSIDLDDVDLLGIEDFQLFNLDAASEIEVDNIDEKPIKHILQITLPNEMEMHDLKDDLLHKGYNVKVVGE